MQTFNSRRLVRPRLFVWPRLGGITPIMPMGQCAPQKRAHAAGGAKKSKPELPQVSSMRGLAPGRRVDMPPGAIGIRVWVRLHIHLRHHQAGNQERRVPWHWQVPARGCPV